MKNKRVTRFFKTAALSLLCSTAFAVTPAEVQPLLADQRTADPAESEPPSALALAAGPAPDLLPELAAGTQGMPDSRAEPVGGGGGIQLAQFQLPSAPSGGATSPGEPDAPTRHPERPLIQQLTYQFSYGSESDITYRRNPDLDKRLRDNALILVPQINGSIIYRPNAHVEMMLEMLLEREFAVHEERIVTLPNGDTQFAPRRRFSLPIDQAWVSFKDLGPFDITLGRRNFEDGRHWLYDTSLDAALLRFKQGPFQAEASFSRKDRLDLDLLSPVQKTRTNNYMMYLDYRGIEDVRLASYAILRHDRTGVEGRPLHLGLRAYGMPSDKFNFWTELGILRGKDATRKNFKAHGFDVGGTYRFTDLPYAPNVTLGYAYGSGDDNSGDSKNHEFRQTGLQSNEGKFGGIPQLKYYGEVLDPELSNLRILTAGVGFRPVQNVTVDLVFHHYRLNRIADEIRNSALTAQMNQDDTRLSRNVGKAVDIVFGFRNLFGVRRLGLDVRAGLFFPGTAFRNEDPATGTFHKANKSISFLAKIWF